MHGRFETSRDGEATYVKISGVIDGRFGFDPLLEQIDSPVVILNLAAVDNFNGEGRTGWKRFLSALCGRSDVLIWDCPPDLAELFNEMPALVDKAKIASFRVPYQCSSCEKDIPVRLDAASLNPDDVGGELCAGCDGKLRVQRNPETLIDLRRHASKAPSGIELKPRIRLLERRLVDKAHRAAKSGYIVETASDLPHVFEQTQSQMEPEPPQPVASEPTYPESNFEDSVDESSEAVDAMSGETVARGIEYPAAGPLRKESVDEVSAHQRQPSARGSSARTFRAQERIPLLPVAAVGFAGIVLGLLAGLMLSDEGLSPATVLAFSTELNEGNFEKAKSVLDGAEDDLPAELVLLYRQEIDRARADATQFYIREARRALQEKRFEEAVQYGRDALRLDKTNGEMLFLVGEALRLSGKNDAALTYYHQFTERFPDSMHADDAMYWRAAALAAQGQYDLATSLCERILANEKSNFHTAAKRLLRSIPN